MYISLANLFNHCTQGGTDTSGDTDSGIFVNKDQSIIVIIYIDNILFLDADKQKLLKN